MGMIRVFLLFFLADLTVEAFILMPGKILFGQVHFRGKVCVNCFFFFFFFFIYYHLL